MRNAHQGLDNVQLQFADRNRQHIGRNTTRIQVERGSGKTTAGLVFDSAFVIEQSDLTRVSFGGGRTARRQSPGSETDFAETVTRVYPEAAAMQRSAAAGQVGSTGSDDAIVTLPAGRVRPSP